MWRCFWLKCWWLFGLWSYMLRLIEWNWKSHPHWLVNIGFGFNWGWGSRYGWWKFVLIVWWIFPNRDNPYSCFDLFRPLTLSIGFYLLYNFKLKIFSTDIFGKIISFLNLLTFAAVIKNNHMVVEDVFDISPYAMKYKS